MAKPEVICWLCKKPIKGKPHFQGGSLELPSHKKCLVGVKPDKRTGGI